MKQIALCPNCTNILIQVNTGKEIDTYCEECGWPDECRPPSRERELWDDGFEYGFNWPVEPNKDFVVCNSDKEARIWDSGFRIGRVAKKVNK